MCNYLPFGGQGVFLVIKVLMYQMEIQSQFVIYNSRTDTVLYC